ncbi:hypothetical protein PAMA_015485 [Pampus argenteus]
MAYSTSTLAQGCFGKVYKEKYNDTWAAIKKVPQHLINRKDLERECEVYNKANHPNIVKLLGNINLKDSKWIIPMEFIFGEDLETTIFKASKSKIQLTPSNKGTIIIGMCEGLLLLHAKDIVHQDLKPENIMVEHNTNRAVIIDLGLAKFFRNGLNSAIDMGNEAYSAPEVLQRRSQRDQRSDVWAMGKIIAELCARVRLYTPSVCPAKIKETLQDQPYCQAVCRMVEPNPSLRASMGGVISSIRRASQQGHLLPPSSHINARNQSPSPMNRELNGGPSPMNKCLNRDPSPMNRGLNRDPSPMNKGFNRDPSPMNRGLNRDPSPMNKGFNRDPSPMNRGLNRDPLPMNKGLNRDPSPMNRGLNRDPLPMNKGFNRDPSPMNRGLNRDPLPMNRGLNGGPSPINKGLNGDPSPMNRGLNGGPSPMNRGLNGDPSPMNRGLNGDPSPMNRGLNGDPSPMNRGLNRDPLPMNKGLNGGPSPMNRGLNRDPSPMNMARSLFNKDPSPLNRDPSPFNRDPLPVNRPPAPLKWERSPKPELKPLGPQPAHHLSPSPLMRKDKNENQALVPTGAADLTQDFMKMRLYQEAAKDLPCNLPATGRVVVRHFEKKNGMVETWAQKEMVIRDGKIVKYDDVRFNNKLE